jgi:hypothetical protein
MHAGPERQMPTDVEIPSPVAGTIKLIVTVGVTYEVGTVIAELT